MKKLRLKDIYYTASELAEKLKYASNETFLKALKENEKFNRGNAKLSMIWSCRERITRRFLFNKEKIDQILPKTKSK